MSVIEQLKTSRIDAVAKMDGIIAKATARGDKMLASESREFTRVTAEIADIDDMLERQESRRSALNATAGARNRLGLGEGGGISIRSEERTYHPGNKHERSYFRDLGLMAFPGVTAEYFAAADRLVRHAHEVEVEARENPDSITAKSYRQLMGRMGQDVEQRAGLTTSVGSGGTFLPPDYILELYIKFPRQMRVLADLVRKMTLPRGPMTIELPKITAGTATAPQATQNTAAQETDLTDAYVTASVNTFAGAQTVSLQAIEQSAIPFDEIVFEDLTADLDREMEFQVVDGSGTSGNATGVVNVSGIGAVTYTDSTPTAAKAWPFIAQAKATVFDSIHRAADTILMTPDRWSWFEAATDANGRPLIVPLSNGPWNAVGTVDGQLQNGPQAVGKVLGLPVYVTSEIPTNLGAGTNQDEIVVLSVRDSFLWESAPVARALPQTLGNELSVILQTYIYAAFMGNRLPGAICTIGGTGFVPPTY